MWNKGYFFFTACGTVWISRISGGKFWPFFIMILVWSYHFAFCILDCTLHKADKEMNVYWLWHAKHTLVITWRSITTTNDFTKDSTSITTKTKVTSLALTFSALMKFCQAAALLLLRRGWARQISLYITVDMWPINYTQTLNK